MILKIILLRLKSNYAFFKLHRRVSLWSSLVTACSPAPLTPVVSVSQGRPPRLVGSSLQAETAELQSLPAQTHVFTHPVVLNTAPLSAPLAVESLPALHSLQTFPQHLLTVDKTEPVAVRPQATAVLQTSLTSRLPGLLSDITRHRSLHSIPVSLGVPLRSSSSE